MRDHNRGISQLGDNLVFLIGLPRSGTTLLSQLLNNHPEIDAPPEPWVMLAFHQLGRVDSQHPANAWVVQQAVETFAGADGLISASRAGAAALYNTRLVSVGKSILVDKTPRYLLILDYLRLVFPHAKFVCLLRDPFDIAASYRSTYRVNLADILAEVRDNPYLFDFTISLDRLDQFIRQPDATIHIVRYEELVTDPAGTLSKLLGGLGLFSNAALLDGMCKLQPRARQSGEFGDRKIEQTSSPHTDSIGGYRKTFGTHELQELLNSVGLERLHRLGYRNTAQVLTELGLKVPSETRRLEKQSKIEAMFHARLAGTKYIPAGKGSFLDSVRDRIRSRRWSGKKP